jgi:hypothetical protein
MPLLPRRRSKRVPWSERERLGHEAPGTVLRGPPITIKCDCGEKKDLRYGDVWVCESCGKRWNTNQIPREQYDVIRKTQLRFRVLPIALGSLVALIALFFILTGNILSLVLLLPMAILIWFVFIRPTHRRRYREAIKNLPRWELYPE